MSVGYLLLLAALPATGSGWSAAEAEVVWSKGQRERVIVEDSVWRCDGATCSGRVQDTPLLKQRACRAIARYAGGVTRFATASGELAPDALARCNGRR